MDTGISHRRVEPAVAEECLNGGDVGSGIDQLRAKGVSEHVGCHPKAQACSVATSLAKAHNVWLSLSRKPAPLAAGDLVAGSPSSPTIRVQDSGTASRPNASSSMTQHRSPPPPTPLARTTGRHWPLKEWFGCIISTTCKFVTVFWVFVRCFPTQLH